MKYLYYVKVVEKNTECMPVNINGVVNLRIVAENMSEAIEKAVSFFEPIVRVKAINAEEIGKEPNEL